MATIYNEDTIEGTATKEQRLRSKMGRRGVVFGAARFELGKYISVKEDTIEGTIYNES